MSLSKSVQGFTLIELLIVMVLLSVSISMVLPFSFNRIESTEARKEREQVLILLSKSRMDSFFYSTPITLKFSNQKIEVFRAGVKTENGLLFSHIDFETVEHVFYPFSASSKKIEAKIRNRVWLLEIEGEAAEWSNTY